MARLRFALALALAGAVGLVLPALVGGAEPSAIVVASLAAALAAMAHLGARGELAPAFALVRVPTERHVPGTVPGRVTDPVHHPIRRRAPGQV